MRLQKMLVVVSLVASPLIWSVGTIATPRIDLILIGLLNLGVFFTGAITLVGILSVVSGVLFLQGGTANLNLAFQLLA